MGITAGIVGAVSTVASVGVGLYSAEKQQEAQKEAIAAQQKAEAARQQAMELDAKRKQLDVLRTQQRARALAVSSANASGSIFGSGLQGGLGQISGQSNTNMLGIGQSLDLGRDVFAANSQLSNAKMDMADAQSIGYIGTAMGSLGKDIFNSAPQIGRLGKYYGIGLF